jgi:hypothetical protein
MLASLSIWLKDSVNTCFLLSKRTLTSPNDRVSTTTTQKKKKINKKSNIDLLFRLGCRAFEFPGQGFCSLGAGAGLGITGVTIRTAVTFIRTAHSLWHGTAAIAP